MPVYILYILPQSFDYGIYTQWFVDTIAAM